MDTVTLLSGEQEEVNRVVVRLKTEYYSTDKGYFIKKCILPMKRKCIGFNFLSEDVVCMGEMESLQSIKNVSDVPDGLYYVKVVNELRDWETGYIEEWEYKLIPYVEDE